MRRGPRPLVILSLVCILDLILSIVSGGLFEPQLKHHSETTSHLLSRYNLSTFAVPSFTAPFDGYSLIPSGNPTDTFLLPWTIPGYSFIPFAIDEPEDERTSYTATTRGIGADLMCESLPLNHSWIDSQSARAYWRYKPFGDEAELNCTVEIPNGGYGYVQEYIHYLTPPEFFWSSSCATSTILILALWNTMTATLMDSGNTVALHCEPSIHIQDFAIQFDHSGWIEAYDPVPGSLITSGELVHNASRVLAQFNGALKRLAPRSTSFDPEILIRAVQSAYATIFSTHLTLRRDIYLDRLAQADSAAVEGTVTHSVWGLLPSTPSIIIVIVLVSLDVLVIAGVFVTRRRRFHGPRIPKTIGSIIPWIAHSRMMDDFNGTHQWTDAERQKHLE
ncbi:hypothetical protein BBP40_009996 [Aspergillus hancockii]|nr:hypothetical protein BBP40_009996 [Aspergillus hancockii]